MSSFVAGSHKWSNLCAFCFILSWIFGDDLSLSLHSCIFYNAWYYFFCNVFWTDNGKSIPGLYFNVWCPTECKFMSPPLIIIPNKLINWTWIIDWNDYIGWIVIAATAWIITGAMMSLWIAFAVDGIAGTWQGTGTDLAKQLFFFQLWFANVFVYFFLTVDGHGWIGVTASSGTTFMWSFAAEVLELMLSITQGVSTVGVRDGNCMCDASWLGVKEIVANSISKLVFAVSLSIAVSLPTSSF